MIDALPRQTSWRAQREPVKRATAVAFLGQRPCWPGAQPPPDLDGPVAAVGLSLGASPDRGPGPGPHPGRGRHRPGGRRPGRPDLPAPPPRCRRASESPSRPPGSSAATRARGTRRAALSPGRVPTTSRVRAQQPRPGTSKLPAALEGGGRCRVRNHTGCRRPHRQPGTCRPAHRRTRTEHAGSRPRGTRTPDQRRRVATQHPQDYARLAAVHAMAGSVSGPVVDGVAGGTQQRTLLHWKRCSGPKAR